VAEAAKKSTNRFKKWPRTSRGGGTKVCGVKDCKRPYRAKGYCFFHYKKWRHAELPHSRYRTCSKPECRKKVVKGGLCEQHIAEAKKATEVAAPAAAAPAAPAA
jgi:hypothetical protein